MRSQLRRVPGYRQRLWRESLLMPGGAVINGDFNNVLPGIWLIRSRCRSLSTTPGIDIQRSGRASSVRWHHRPVVQPRDVKGSDTNIQQLNEQERYS